MATNAPITGVPTHAPFNPTEWLSRFESVGGAYMLANERLHLFIVRNPGSPPNARQAQAMLDWLTFEQHRAIEDRLVQREHPVRREPPAARFHTFTSQTINLIGRINRACRESKITTSKFGRLAINDPMLFGNLLRGRTLRPKTEARLNAFIASLGETRHGA